MSFTFNTTIPATNNNPSNDQPIMQQNNVATNGILNVDHITFNTLNGGQHKQVTFPAFVTPAVPAGNASVINSNVGVASSKAQLYFQNSVATYPINIVRAYGIGQTGGGVVSSQSFNLAAVNPIVRNSVGNYTVTMVANAVASDKYGVLVTASSAGGVAVNIIANYQIISATQFRLFFVTIAALVDPTVFTFQVIQV